MSAAEHDTQHRDSEPWHVGSPASIGDQEITLLALVDATGLVDAGVLDAQGNYMATAALRHYVAALQGMLAQIDALA
jgi:hypothetical protein